MWSFSRLSGGVYANLEFFVHNEEKVVLVYNGPELLCVSINYNEYLLTCIELDPPAPLAELYVDFARKFDTPLRVGVGSPILLDQDGYFVASVDTPWDEHILFSGKKLTAEIRDVITRILPQPIYEEMVGYILSR